MLQKYSQKNGASTLRVRLLSYGHRECKITLKFLCHARRRVAKQVEIGMKRMEHINNRLVSGMSEPKKLGPLDRGAKVR
jgi:hypothetical protein